jgi:hypothetical protein
MHPWVIIQTLDFSFSFTLIRGCLIAKRGVSHKVLDETDNLQKPNPPTPFPTREGGVKASLRFGERFTRGVNLYLENFYNILLEFSNFAAGEETE